MSLKGTVCIYNEQLFPGFAEVCGFKYLKHTQSFNWTPAIKLICILHLSWLCHGISYFEIICFGWKNIVIKGRLTCFMAMSTIFQETLQTCLSTRAVDLKDKADR